MTIRILAFNTVTELCSVALMIDDEIYNYNIIAPRFHAEKILPMINQLLIDYDVMLKSLDCIVFDQGPGSFIGVRVGISVAQGLALGADLPVVAVSSLEVLAQGASRIFSAKHVITTIDARMNELYWSHYSCSINNDFWICKNDPCLITTSIAQQLIDTLEGKWVLVGTGWNSNQKLESYINNSIAIIKKKRMLPEAQDMLSLGVRAYKKQIFLTPNQITPIYLRTNVIKKNIIST